MTQSPRLSSASEGRQVLVVALLLLCISLTPLVLVHIPPLVDYPNHMARMYILADGGRSAYLRQYYEIHWDILPNLAMDVLVPAIAVVVGIEAAGKVFIGLIMALLSSGVFALHYVLHRRWSWWPFLMFFFLFNNICFGGF
jgi:hypothetical protein